MAARKTPALYELMGGDEPERRPPEEPRDESRLMRWLGAGRSIRLPVGYIWLAAAIVVVAVAGAFSLGFVRGQREAETAYQRDWLAMNAMPVPPPEVAHEGFDGLATHLPAIDPATTAQAPPAEAGPAGAGWGDVESDPRQEGVNYFVLLTTYRDNALAFARFCRDNDVEAYVVTSNNSSYHRVVALPGYLAGDRSSEAVRDLERRIVEVARKWKLQVNPRDNLAYYPERFKG